MDTRLKRTWHHVVSHLTRMDFSDVFTPVLDTMPVSSPPNSSLDNVSQTSSSSRSPPLPPHSQMVSVFIVLVVTVIILGTVVGNVLVVMAVFTSRALRAPQNLFLVSLASADILVATLVIPFSLANEVRNCNTGSAAAVCSGSWGAHMFTQMLMQSEPDADSSAGRGSDLSLSTVAV